jgi:L-aspartate oxidase
MWNYVGIVRSKRRLDRALSDLNYFTHRIEKFYQEARATESILELRNAVLVGTLISKAAAGNHRSLGCHYRTDAMN